jgi:hypothetical protein
MILHTVHSKLMESDIIIIKYADLIRKEEEKDGSKLQKPGK